MIHDPIVEETRRVHKEHAAQYGNNLQRIVEALREKERLNPGPKRLTEKMLRKEARSGISGLLADVPRWSKKYLSGGGT
ncbi:MAG: hypothetical protein D3908_06395 [Candidatus Electrothrix sp. AUS4]|nr:hypothetical protein [Candidatus Electrothrix sp. AUS4]